MEINIVDLEAKTMVGMVTTMSGNKNLTRELFSTFMPVRKHIANQQSACVYDVRIYPNGYFNKGFNPTLTFQKWAAMEVSKDTIAPVGMQQVEIPAGKYASFMVPNNNDPSLFQYIFTEWLPKFNYSLDERPHMDVFDEQAIAKVPNAMQRIMIPIK